MRKLYGARLIGFVFCLCVFGNVRGQWVTIPTPFANYIAAYVDPAAISGSQLDTTNNNVLTLQNWTINNYTGLNDITGIQYFKGLQNLVINATTVANLPPLPINLQTLESHSTALVSFSGIFPATLGIVKFYNAHFKSIPIGFPANMQTLIMNNCTQDTSLPAFPASLQWINIAYSYLLTSLPALPSGLIDLSLTNLNLISALPPLPNNLTTLYLVGMPALATLPPLASNLDSLVVISPSASLTSLPALPGILRSLTVYIPQNGFTALPVLPNSLEYLKMDGCLGLTTLPSLPNSLQYLSASNSQLSLTAYPPALRTFICQNCSNLTSLPVAPQTLSYLDVQNCNIISMDTFPDSMSYVCLSNNPITSINFLPHFVSSQLLMNNMPNLRYLNIDSIKFAHDPHLLVGFILSINNCPHASSSLTTFLERIHTVTWDNYDGTREYDTNSSISISATSDSIVVFPAFNALVYRMDFSYNPIHRLTTQPLLPGPLLYPQYPLDGGGLLYFSHCLIDSLNPLFFRQGPNHFWPMEALDLSYNNFTTINWLPWLGLIPQISAGELDLSNNQITDIQVPIDAVYAHLENNQINCLPYLLEVERLWISGNPINCLPNIPTNIFQCDQSLSVCTSGNSNGCPVYSQPGGMVFNDLNQNGVKDIGEDSLSGYYVKMDSVNAIHVSDNTGHYIFQCEP
ncbi:MAG: disease resistance protein TAO1-like, partial [Bacteroidota bacterium]|nr:disease resistance protein TAO1-like [Bacteroidota bacterium]